MKNYSTSMRYGILVNKLSYYVGFLANRDRRMLTSYKVKCAKTFNTKDDATAEMAQLEKWEDKADALPLIGKKTRNRKTYKLIGIKTKVEVVNV